MRQTPLRTAEVTVGGIARILGQLAALSVAGMVVLLAGSSIRRYLLGAPIAATEELTALFFVALSFLSLAEGFVTGRQIRVLVLWQRLPERFKGAAIVLGELITLVVLALVIKATLDFALTSYSLGSRSYVSGIILWPWMMLVPFGLGLCFVAVLVKILLDVRRLRRNELLPEQLQEEVQKRLDP